MYGSLAEGESNHWVIEHIKGIWYPATIKGKIIDNGWSIRKGYPQYVPSKHEMMNVLVFVSEELHLYWKDIDEFEGEEYYERILIPYVLEAGTTHNGYIYQAKK